MEKIHTANFIANTRDCDFNNNLRISSIYQFLQDAASSHAAELNVGWEDLGRNNIFWALIWSRVEVYHYPKFKENITVKTWPKGRHRIYAIRDFILLDNDGKVFCKATTAWVLVNVNTKRVADLNTLNYDDLNFHKESALENLPGRLNFPIKLETKEVRKIKYSDMDINLHTNNAKYIDFAFDLFDQEFHKNHKAAAIDFYISSETKMDDEIILNLNNENNFHFVEGINKETSKNIFQMKIEWQQ